MINYRTPELLAHLFPSPVATDEIEVTEPLWIDPSVEAVGIDFSNTRFIVFFADVIAYGGSDPHYVRQTAAAWNNGFVPAAGSRWVKFVHADADADTMFDPAEWPLPDAAMIWQFIEALAAAVEGHAVGSPAVTQYFLCRRPGSWTRLSNRMSRQFERGEYGSHCVP